MTLNLGRPVGISNLTSGPVGSCFHLRFVNLNLQVNDLF